MAPPVVIPRARGHVFIAGTGCLLSLSLLAIIPLAILEEGDTPPSVWLCMALVAGGIGLLSALVGRRAITRAEVYGSRLELIGLRRRVVPYAAITGIEHGDALHILTADGRIRVRLATRSSQAHLKKLLEDRVDGARAARTARLQRGLPLSIGRRGSVIATNIALGLTFGPGMALLGLVTLGHAVLERRTLPVSDMLLQGGMGLAWVLVGGLLGALLLGSFVRRYTFTDDRIVIHHLLWAKTWPVDALTGVALRSETRTFKGVPRTAWFLALTFSGDRTVKIALSENGYPMEWSAADDQQALGELQTMLRRCYHLSDG
jgi:hypothetical protein